MSWGGNMHPFTLQLWQRLHAAGAEGLLRTELREEFPGRDDLAKRLANLVTLGYVLQQGKYNEARFTATTKVPPSATKAADEAAARKAEDPEDAMRREARSKTPQGVPAGVPNSVFDLGRTLCGGKSAGLPEAAAEAAPVAAPPSAPAPAALSAAQRAGLPWNQPAQLDIPTLGKLPAHLTPRKPAAPPDAAPPEPRFELHSDGVLLIDPAGDGTEPIALHPTVTRHLFRWLDRIGGLQLSRVFECGTEATS